MTINPRGAVAAAPHNSRKEQLMETIEQTAGSGYVLIVHRKGYRSTHVHGRYSHDIVEEAKRRLEQRDEYDEIKRIEIQDAEAFQAHEDDQLEHRPWHDRLHDDWGQPLNVLDFPLMTTLKEL
jgi:hypothetical protein